MTPMAKRSSSMSPAKRSSVPSKAVPVTPMTQGPKPSYSPPPLSGYSMGVPSLMKCLRIGKSMENGGVEHIRAYLAAEPEAATQFFFDFGFEPVVCFAVRLGCAPEILHLLIQHGADAGACEVSGYSPLTSLAAFPSLAIK